MKSSITTLFLDIGGVLLTNGWDTPTRDKAIAHFKLNGEEIQERHQMELLPLRGQKS
jgi:putative hydrolase of the HAD superfamily